MEIATNVHDTVLSIIDLDQSWGEAMKEFTPNSIFLFSQKKKALAPR